MSEPVFETLRWDLSGPVLTLTLHRPERMNAMTRAMRRELCRALDLADAQDVVRAIVITGAGRAFCAGFDLSEGAQAFDPAAAARDAESGEEAGRDGGGVLALRLFASTKPLIAAVNGAAVGIGASMLLPMDIRIASRDARFGFVFARRGIVPDACASWFLPRVAGISKALEWSMGGHVFDAEEARAGGLVSELCEPGELLARAQSLAAEIATHAAPVSVALTRQLMWRMLGAPHPMEAHRLESAALRSRGASADAAEGVASFREKRPARFPDDVSTGMPAPYPWWTEPPFAPTGDTTT
ncbi:enoyl-CoA hydratase-related protein [Variovorax sp.]|jgi:enoyl-CoA hydratase/carnithine racemase|uniref:enoyl-CoA hydratase-related protein n=1 Tax=Variovorax sp. TaxID=1871043 RepID=UPI001226D87F|nr:enoyl-CoA hydratase-related protein [Variovorax sp.]TAJ61433.1 MAG: enoyl-CoA hydratase [Variovorax sp.]